MLEHSQTGATALGPWTHAETHEPRHLGRSTMSSIFAVWRTALTFNPQMPRHSGQKQIGWNTMALRPRVQTSTFVQWRLNFAHTTSCFGKINGSPPGPAPDDRSGAPTRQSGPNFATSSHNCSHKKQHALHARGNLERAASHCCYSTERRSSCHPRHGCMR